MHSGLKNMMIQSDDLGEGSSRRDYDAFGNVTSATGSWVGPFGYAGGFGYQEDATGLKLLGHRYYDSSTGRFITRDPIKDARNYYVYCHSNPLTLADMDGLKPATITPLPQLIEQAITGTPPVSTQPPPVESGEPPKPPKDKKDGKLGTGPVGAKVDPVTGQIIKVVPQVNLPGSVSATVGEGKKEGSVEVGVKIGGDTLHRIEHGIEKSIGKLKRWLKL